MILKPVDVLVVQMSILNKDGTLNLSRIGYFFNYDMFVFKYSGMLPGRCSFVLEGQIKIIQISSFSISLLIYKRYS